MNVLVGEKQVFNIAFFHLPDETAEAQLATTRSASPPGLWSVVMQEGVRLEDCDL